MLSLVRDRELEDMIVGLGTRGNVGDDVGVAEPANHAPYACHVLNPGRGVPFLAVSITQCS